MTWIEIPDFVNDQIIVADDWQDIWENLDFLKNRPTAEQRLPGPANAAWTLATANTWLDIDTTNYRLPFESFGNPLLMVAGIQATHSVANGAGFFAFELDGTRAGNTLGLMRIIDTVSGPLTAKQMQHIWWTVAAGDHTLDVQWRTTGATLEVWKAACLKVSVWEF